MTPVYGAIKFTIFAVFGSYVLDLLLEAGTAEVVKTWERLGILRKFAASDALETTKRTPQNVANH